MASTRDIKSMDVYTIDSSTGKKTITKAGTSSTTLKTISSSSPVDTSGDTIKKTVDWSNIANIPEASEEQDGILTSEFFKVLKNSSDKLTDDVITRLLRVLDLYYSYSSASDFASAISNLADGDVVTVSSAIDANETLLKFNGVDVTIKLDANLTSSNSGSSGINISNGTVTLEGNGKLFCDTDYDKQHGSGILAVGTDGEVIFNGAGIESVTSDPENKGNFGVVNRSNGKITINDGDFKAGWYCVSGNGSSTNKDAVTTINGGNLVSVADYAVYHPHVGTLNINGGFITGASGAVAVNGGIVNITGGILSSTGTAEMSDQWSDGTSGLGNAALNLNARWYDITCRISGGRFVAAGDAVTIATGAAHNVDLVITGGEFSTKPDASWIAEGYHCTEDKNKDGFYEVVKDDE